MHDVVVHPLPVQIRNLHSSNSVFSCFSNWKDGRNENIHFLPRGGNQSLHKSGQPDLVFCI